MKSLLAFILSLASFAAWADAPPFRLAAWQVPPEDVLKWKARNVGTFAGHVDFGGRMSKAEWERQVAERGGKFITYPGDDVKAEAQQFGRVGFIQWDEPDLSNHVDKPGYTIAEMKARYDRVKATGVPMYMTLGAADNEWYDGHPKPQKTDGSKYGHRAADGGWMAYADVCGFDFYLYTFNRGTAQYPVIKRLLDRMNDWSGGKPCYLFIETCTQGKGTPMTADQWEDQVWNAVNYCKAKGYKLAGVFYFSHIVFPNWKSFDGTPPEIADRMTAVNAKLLQMFSGPPVPDPAPVPEVVAILKQQLADAQGEIAAKDAQIRDLNTQAAVAAVELTAQQQATAAAKVELATTKAKLDQSESTRQTAAAQAATLAETLKSPQPPPTTRPSALLVTPSNLIPPSPAPFGEANWGHPSVIARDKVPKDYTQADVERYADACESGDKAYQPKYPGGEPWGPPIPVFRRAPTFLDYEGADITPAQVRQHLLWFKAKAPHVPVGVIGYPYYDATGNAEPFKPVRELEDFVSGGAYLNRPDSTESDLKIIREGTQRIHDAYPSKPMYFWMSPEYFGTVPPSELKPEAAAAFWALAREQTPGVSDRIVIYCDLAGALDVTARAFGGMK